MNKSESKYFNTATRMDEAFLQLLSQKDYEYITVKEICAASGVNRSTFYLHYETINDLLLETVEYINGVFQSYFSHIEIDQDSFLSAPKADLVFIRPEFLTPWLTFIREKKVIYRTVLKEFNSLQIGSSMYKTIYKTILVVLERYGIAEKKREYMIVFYLEGINAIVKEWLRRNCQDNIEDIIDVIVECVRPQ